MKGIKDCDERPDFGRVGAEPMKPRQGAGAGLGHDRVVRMFWLSVLSILTFALLILLVHFLSWWMNEITREHRTQVERLLERIERLERTSRDLERIERLERTSRDLCRHFDRVEGQIYALDQTTKDLEDRLIKLEPVAPPQPDSEEVQAKSSLHELDEPDDSSSDHGSAESMQPVVDIMQALKDSLEKLKGPSSRRT
jgi:hypothetical protein